MGETWAALERSLHRTAKRVLRPRLNQLRQYPPRAVAVAADSGASAPAGDPASLPTLALVTPSYKQGAFIRATIDSVLGQGYPKLRYVVMDGGSADGTQDILASYGDRLDWWSGPDRGQAEAINKGFERVSGEIMGWVNSDDLLLPGTLAFVAGFFRDHPEIDLIYGHRIIIDEQGQEIGRWVLPRHDPAALAFTDYVPQETMFWRAALWAAAGPLDAGFHYAMDWDFLLRAQRAGFRFRRLPRFLGCFRVHGEQKTAQTLELTHEMDRLRAAHFGRPVSQREISRGLRFYQLRQLACDWRYRLVSKFQGLAQ
ncbi:MAG TPA: glycosyltransferase family 2 protein [Verrucomicrobiae bacterium]|nr:glycosyltransferase family 2 protein [Verrucomicrobiae bacterium]